MLLEVNAVGGRELAAGVGINELGLDGRQILEQRVIREVQVLELSLLRLGQESKRIMSASSKSSGSLFEA